MPTKFEALAILFVLLPGFLAAYISQQLAVRRTQTEIEKVSEALIFSFLLYLCTLPFFGNALPVSWEERSSSALIAVHYRQIVTLLIASVLLGVGYAASINHDWLLAMFRYLRVTERTARSAIWHDAFQEITGFVQVELKDGRKILGWVRYYSDDPSDAALFLEKASWVDDGSEIKIDGPGILITKDAGIESVTFLDWSVPEVTDASKEAI